MSSDSPPPDDPLTRRGRPLSARGAHSSQGQQQQRRAAAASADTAPPLHRSQLSLVGFTLIDLPPAHPSLSAFALPPLLALPPSSAARAPKPIHTIKSSDSQHELHNKLKQRSNKDAAEQREAAVHTPASAAAESKGTAAASAAASAHKPQTASRPVPSTASSSSAAAASVPSDTPRVLPSSDHAGLVPLLPIAPPTRNTDQPAPSSSSAEPDGPAGVASNEWPQPSPSSARGPSLSSSVTAAPAVWFGVKCDGCGQSPLIGVCFRCTVCSDFDLCEECEAKRVHTHPMQRCNAPAELEQQLLTVQRRSAVPRANGAAASGNAAASTASQPLSSSAAAAGHSQFTPDADDDDPTQFAAASAQLSRGSQRRAEESDDELSEGQVPNSSDDDDDDAEMDDAAVDDDRGAAVSHTGSGSAAPVWSVVDSSPSQTAPGAEDRAVAESSARNNTGGSDSRSGSEYIPPRPTLVECGDSRVKFETQLAKWEARYGGRADAEQEQEPLTRDRRRARLLRNESYEERWDAVDRAAAASTRPHRSRRPGLTAHLRTKAAAAFEGNDAEAAAAASSAVELDDVALPDEMTAELLRRAMRRRHDPNPTASAKAYSACEERTGHGELNKPLSASSSAAAASGTMDQSRCPSADGLVVPHDRAVTEPSDDGKDNSNSGSSSSNEVDLAAAASTPPGPPNRPGLTAHHFYIDESGSRIERPVRGPTESEAECRRRYNRWLKAVNAVWTKEALAAASATKEAISSEDSDLQDGEESQAASAPSSAPRSSQRLASRHRRVAALKDASKADGGGGGDEADLDQGQPLDSAPSSSAVNVARPLAQRHLPDSYVDGGQVMTRPVRAVGESKDAFKARSRRWRRRALVIGAPGFEKGAGSRHSRPVAAASSSAAAACSAPAPSNPLQFSLGNSPYQVMSQFAQFSQFMASYHAGQAAAGGAAPAVPPLASQLQAPAHAAAVAPVDPALIPLPSSSASDAAMRDVSGSVHASASLIPAPSRPALDGSHSWAAQSSHLMIAPQSASPGAGAASSLTAPPSRAAAAGSAAKGKRKSASHDRSDHADGSGAGSDSATAAAAAPSSDSTPASKKARCDAPLSLSLSTADSPMQQDSDWEGENGAGPSALCDLAVNYCEDDDSDVSTSAAAAAAASRSGSSAHESHKCGPSAAPILPRMAPALVQAAQLRAPHTPQAAASTSIVPQPVAAASAAALGGRPPLSAPQSAASSSHARPPLSPLSGLVQGAQTHAPDTLQSAAAASSGPQPAAAASAVASVGRRRAPQSAASISDSADVRSFLLESLAATSTLELILAQCIPDPSKRDECLACFADQEITLDHLEDNFSLWFPREGKSKLVQSGWIKGAPCTRLEDIIRHRIEWKQQMDNDCIQVKREARAAGK